MIDLHTHTTASDGSLTPTELVAAAHAAGLEAVGITDHDTAAGVAEARAAGGRFGLRVIPGIELTARFEGGTLHLLGYGIDPEEPRFAAGIDRLQRARSERNPKIIRNLQAMGLPITLEQVVARAGGGQVGRPHIAQALVTAGVVESVQEAFDRYLASHLPAYEHKFRLDPPAIFALITAAGGIPVMAHPSQTRRIGEDLRRLVAELAAAGLEGIETRYPGHTPEQTARYEELAAEFDLVPTGGSDFHGLATPGIALGRGAGDLCVPAAFLTGLDERIAAVRSRAAS